MSGKRGRIPRHAHAQRGRRTRTYVSWVCMQRRCNNRNHGTYKYYGGRGITVCKRWRIFENFLADMGARPLDKTLDRRRVNGNYTKGNCRWATTLEQRRNRRR